MLVSKICIETFVFVASMVFLGCASYLYGQRIRLLYLDAHPEKRNRCPIYYVGKYVGNKQYVPFAVCSKEKYYHEQHTWIIPTIYLLLWIGFFVFFLVLVCNKQLLM